ncbi:zinc finger protein CONSTANS-like [Gastrolobium bilobum]|uniref:zinc finger protein CONSTANS-like n=1 Tax=Gastrolobium bilobum TaxID=150636 RepID=UPI002AB2E589|nr:zinc finger protein CONSTANS-like [Gastrolobium bilobum]
MKNCELCKVPARTFCESDQASLCWDCDAKVHGANFLVARHSRTLLCRSCQSLTPWKASGAALGNTVSLCERCAGGTKIDDPQQGEESEGGNDDYIDTDNDDDDDDDIDTDDDDQDEDEDGDNQVVPWSSTAPPPASSSSSSEESVSTCNNRDEEVSQPGTTISLKRRRLDHDFQEGLNSCAYQRRHGARWRGEVALVGYDGEPPSKASRRSLSDG